MPGFYLKGAFVKFTQTFLVPTPDVVVFQFNPETVTHSWSPSAPEVTSDNANKPNPLAVKGVPGESFSFTLAMDSNDMIADGPVTSQRLAQATGIYSRLAALEMLLYPSGSFTSNQLLGQVSTAVANSLNGATSSGDPQVPQFMMPLVLFVWGPGRILPVRVNSLNITETLYDNLLLNPTHAEAQVELQVLAPEEVSAIRGPLRSIAAVAYDYSQGLRQTLAAANSASEVVSTVLGMLPFG
jgi:hypothetical protein